MTPSLESVVQQIEQALKTAPTGGFYVDLRLASACNPQSIRILLDALEEAQRDARRYRGFIDTAGRQPICFLGLDYYGKEDLDAAIDKAMEQPK